MKRRTLLASGTALAAATIISGRARAEVVKFKAGHVDTQRSYAGVGLDAFAKEVAKRSRGTMEVDVFHAGTLGAIPDEIKNVFAGAQDMHLIFPEFLSGLLDEAKLISAPYLFRNLNHLALYYKSPLFKPALDRLTAMGSVMLDPDWTWANHDPRGLLSTKPVLTPHDLEGMKVRLWEDKTAIETWRGLGGNVVVVPRPQVYLALKQGLVAASPETMGTAYDSKDDEVGKYWTRTDEYYQIINIMMNVQRWKGLTQEQQQVLTDSAKAAGQVFSAQTVHDFNNKTDLARANEQVTAIQPAPSPWREKGAQVLAKLKESGVVPKDLADKAAALT